MRRKHQATNPGEEPITSINVTPLVDVCLVLVIIMMVTAPMLSQAGIKVSASNAGAGIALETREETVSINISADGTVKVNDRIITEDALEAVLIAQVNRILDMKLAKGAESSKVTAIIGADDDATCDQVVKIMDLGKKCGVDKISLIHKTIRYINEVQKKGASQ